MKNIIKITFISLLLISCGKENLESRVDKALESNDQKALTDLKKEIKTQQEQLKSLEGKIQKELASKQAHQTNYTLITARQIKTDTFKHFFNLQGNVKTDQNILIYPEYCGELEKIFVKEGDEVKKGQVLAKIDDGGLRDQISELQSRVDLAQTTFERQKRLWQDSIGSEIQYLQAKTNFESSQNSLKSLQKKLDKTEIKAPFNGKIDDIITEEGQVVSPGGMAVFRLVNLSEMYIETEVPENYLNDISIGTPVQVRLNAIGKTFQAQIDHMGSFINPNNRKFKVKINIPNNIKGVKPNLIANVLINDYQNNEAIVVSENILQETADGTQICFKIKMDNDSLGQAVRIPLKTGKHYNGLVEVLEGIAVGDIIAQEGGRNLRDKEKVKITQLED
ncbi:efflux RND transporter periplasmic adaptor subunit [Flavobacterium sp. CS20]|uniref:efflux RND transporter periplasmic adaptor subunit n=1 Tax=Flavobacterium sp. CS20 TaxID=2775246 RepID=UPI001B3A15FA|nr:efflux RND transporter periplasmic adaptor subunit [Flavobacterium sp. CS20]QTY26491.1 efflux RND transporter periplasmic adaptor subunit [Flavobacterium sp. CS20]